MRGSGTLGVVGHFSIAKGGFLEKDCEELGFLVGDAFDLLWCPTELLVAGKAKGKAAWGDVRLLDFLAS